MSALVENIIKDGMFFLYPIFRTNPQNRIVGVRLFWHDYSGNPQNSKVIIGREELARWKIFGNSVLKI